MQLSPIDTRGQSTAIVYGAFVLDPDGWSVTVSGKLVPLTASEFILLRELALHAGRVLGRDALEHALASAPGSIRVAKLRTSGRGVDLLVSRVRRKLQRAGYDGIRTLRFVGYGFVPR